MQRASAFGRGLVCVSPQACATVLTMSSLTGETFTVSTTGQVIATGANGNAGNPNEILVKVTAGTALLGGASADALFPITSSDGIVPINLTGGDSLFAKGDGASATVKVFRTKGA